MGIGHVAVGLGLKRADRRINVGWLIFAAFLPDFLLGWFVLTGLESYAVPNDYASIHYLLFTFPWSHGLLADIAWAAIAGVFTWGLAKRRTAAAVVTVAVLSHFLLDGIVHVKGLPLAGNNGPAFGLGLWRHLPLEFSIEAAMAALAIWIYRSVAKTGGSNRWVGMAVYVVALAAFLMAGQAGTTQAPARGGLIAGWLAVPLAISAIAFWLDRRKPAGAKTSA
jgi:hypothetical protein